MRFKNSCRRFWSFLVPNLPSLYEPLEDRRLPADVIGPKPADYLTQSKSRSRRAIRLARKPNPSGRLAILALEERWLPSNVVVPAAIVVNNPSDTPMFGETDLRQAIALANSTSGANSITFDPNVFAAQQTITLNGGTLTLTNTATTTITGPAAGVTISGNATSGVFVIASSASASLSGLTIFGGYTTGNGGGVSNSGTLMMTDSTVTGNAAPSGEGGGIYNSGTATLTNCTITGNFAQVNGGGVNSNTDAGPTTLINCTVTGNSTAGSGGGLSVTANKIFLQNTIVAGNTAANSGQDAFGPFGSLGNNLIGKTNGSSGWIGDLTGTNGMPVKPMLTPLGYYGGPTETMALKTRSPALGAGNSTAPDLPASDERGFLRVVGSSVDIGAFQTQAVPLGVNSSDDTATGAEPAGSLSLRDAINLANALGGGTITFAISGAGPFTIAALSALPTITASLTIDGTTQPGYAGSPLIELNGAGAGAGVNGLTVKAGNSTITGLAIGGFAGDGIDLTTNGGDVIEGNYIGTDATGATALANGGNGVMVSSPGNSIGGITSTPGTGAGNVISGNAGQGLHISAANNLVAGNLFGLNAAGAAIVGNVGTDIVITGASASANTIGGTTSGSRNIISGSITARGLEIVNGANGNFIQGNYVGTDISGSVSQSSAPQGNDLAGIYISTADNTIGGTAPGAGNVLSGNGTRGLRLDTSAATGNVVEGNFIGTNAGGTAPLPNADDGILISGGVNNIIGGTTAGARNIISGNTTDGINITGSGNLVEGNFVGTDVTGGSALPNGGDGININGGATGNIIGGAMAAAANLVSGNTGYGIGVDGATTTGNLLDDDYVGTGVGGSGTIANGDGALQIADGATALIDGTFNGDVSDAGTLDLDGNNASIIGGLTGSGTVTNGAASGTATLSVNGRGAFKGVIQDGSTANVALTVAGGAVTLTGANTFSGGTTVSGGSLQVGNGGTTGSLGTGPVTDNATLIYDFSSSINVANAIGGSGVLNLISSGGSISQAAPIAVSSVAASSSTGATLANAGNAIGNFSATNSTSGNISITNTAATLIVSSISDQQHWGRHLR